MSFSLIQVITSGTGTASLPRVPKGEKPLGRVWDRVPTQKGESRNEKTIYRSRKNSWYSWSER